MARRRTKPVETPTFTAEERLMAAGYGFVAGIDEVGRGPLAGPVLAAAVVLSPSAVPDGIADSKDLAEVERKRLFQEICATAHVAWAAVPPEIIDRINIRQATLLAMHRAFMALPIQADHALIDGRDVPIGLKRPAEAIVGGERICVSIAAASIVAKTVRDRIMQRCHDAHPHYGFASNKGYPTSTHRAVLAERGPCPHHRRSFGPVRSVLERSQAS